MQVEVTLGSPSTLIIIFLQTKLIDPHFTALHLTTQVTDTDNHRLHLAKRRVSHHTDLIVGTVLVVSGIDKVIRSLPLSLCNVPVSLNLCEEVQRNIKHVLFWPHRTASLQRIHVIVSGRCQRQRDFIFIIVALIVTTETYEHRQLMVFKIRGVQFQGVGMHEHLQAFVLPHVDGSILVNGFRLLRTQVCNGQGKCLLITLHKLWLSRILGTSYAWRKYIVDRSLIDILFDIHGTGGHLTRPG